MDYLNRPRILVCTRRVLCKHRESLETSELIFNVWRLQSPHAATDLRVVSYIHENSLTGVPAVEQGFDDMDALAKCIRSIDVFLMAYLKLYEITFESTFPYSLEYGSAFFDETVSKLKENIQGMP